MTIHDAQIEVTCDGGCFSSIYVDPPYVFHSFSGESGQYDTSDETIEGLIEKEGWTVDGDKHYCEDCSSDE